MAENIENAADQELILLHADSLEEAEQLANFIRRKVPDLGGIRFQMIGPVIGAHCGPGTLAACFMGGERTI